MHGDSQELVTQARPQAARIALRSAAFGAKLAWDSRDYPLLAGIIKAMFVKCPPEISRAEVSQMLTQTGCPINYVPVA